MREDFTDYALRITPVADSLNVGLAIFGRQGQRYFRNSSRETVF